MDAYLEKANGYLRHLCLDIPTRLVGTAGNRAATDFFERTASSLGWQTETQRFDSLDTKTGKINLQAGETRFAVSISPYSLGCNVQAELSSAATIEELRAGDHRGKILLLKGDLTKEQLAPKKYVFYNPDHHQEIYRLLESQQPAAIVTATAKNPAMAGAQYPFPLIEDGDFEIPTAFMTDAEGERLAAWAGKPLHLEMEAQRLPSWSENVCAHSGDSGQKRVVVCAHIDAKTGTPGAVDNASGVVVLLLLAEMLKAHPAAAPVELLAMNGEDHYSAGGELAYLSRHAGHLDEIRLAINVDGAGYRGNPSEISLYECPPGERDLALAEMKKYASIREGAIWYQSDHMVFAMNQVPAIALTTAAFMDMETEIAHTEKDTPDLVDLRLLVDIARFLDAFISGLAQGGKHA
jgi:aminopeptidase YwaD